MKKLIALLMVVALQASAIVPSTTNLVNYPSVSGITTSFAVPFKILRASDLVVTVNGALQTLTTNYTVSVLSTTATVRFIVAPAAGTTVLITRQVPFTQLTEFRSQGSLTPKILTDTFDNLELQIQQLSLTNIANSLQTGVLSSADWIRFNQTAFTALNQFQAAGTGAVTLPIGTKLGQIVSVTDFGADPAATAATNSTAFANALVRGSVYVPCGTYLLSTAITISTGNRLFGQAKGCVTLSFTGATSGIVVANNAGQFAIERLTLSTSNASAGSAIDMSAGTTVGGVGYYRFIIRDILILSTGTGRWAYGFNARNAESASVYGLAVYISSTIGVYLADSSNQLKFYDLEITGGVSTDATFNRGIWVDSPGTGMVEFFGGTAQGRFGLGSALYVTGHNPKFYGMHFEVTVASGDVGDVVINGASDVSLTSSHITGTVVVEGVVRGFSLNDSTTGNVTFGSTVQGAYVTNSRVGSITDNGTIGSGTDNGNGWIGCRLTNGSMLRNKGIVEFDAAGSGTATNATTPANAAVSYANGSIMYWRNSTGSNVGLLQLTAADQVFLRYPATKQFNIGNDTPTTKLTFTDTAISVGASLPFTLSSVTFATLPASPANGMLIYCSDCTVASPCASGGTGALAKRINSVWTCN